MTPPARDDRFPRCITSAGKPDTVYREDLDDCKTAIQVYMRDRHMRGLPHHVVPVVHQGERIGYFCTVTNQEWRVDPSIFGD